MTKNLKIKELLPNLTGKERAQLLIKSIYGHGNILNGEENRLLVQIENGKAFNEFNHYINLALNRTHLVFIFSDTFHDFRHKASLLSWLYYQIYNDMPLKILERIVSVNNQLLTGDELLVLDFMKRLNPIEIAGTGDTEVVSFKEDNHQILKGMRQVFSDDLERLVSMREALRKIDLDLGSPSYPKYFDQEQLDDYIKQAKVIQKKHNDAIFHLLKNGLAEKSDLKRELKNLDDYIIKSPLVRDDLVREYIDLVAGNYIDGTTLR